MGLARTSILTKGDVKLVRSVERILVRAFRRSMPEDRATHAESIVRDTLDGLLTKAQRRAHRTYEMLRRDGIL